VKDGFPRTVSQFAHLVHLVTVPRGRCRWCLERREHGGTGILALDRRILELLEKLDRL
jgi:hypothetical protein